MPPKGKSSGSLKPISMVWEAGSVWSVLRRSTKVMAILRSGIVRSPRRPISGGRPGPAFTVSVRQVMVPSKVCGWALPGDSSISTARALPEAVPGRGVGARRAASLEVRVIRSADFA